MGKISVLLVGTGGFAAYYVKELLHAPRAGRFHVVGAVDPYAADSESGREVVSSGIPVYNTLEEFYRERDAQLAILVTPIHLHARQARFCMEHGSDVLCEKPLCASMEEAASMMAARDSAGRRLAIGFQWSFGEGILSLKRDILQGRYGKIRRIRTIANFPRNLDYYHRSTGWAGKRRLDTGEWLLDSIASNAAAHYLHNMLFLTGDQTDRSAEPVQMEAEIYRANPIEMFDTCALRIRTEAGAELLFYATHAVPEEQGYGPEFILEGEKGTVEMGCRERMKGCLSDGTCIDYGTPCPDHMRKLYCMAEAIENEGSLPCIPETALPHLKCICALAESFPETPEFPEEYVRYDENARQYTCKGLGEVLKQCWEKGSLPFEDRIGWALKPHRILFQER